MDRAEERTWLCKSRNTGVMRTRAKRKRRTMDRHSWLSADVKLQIDELEMVAVNAI